MATKKNKLTTVFDGDDKPFQKKIKRVQGSVKKTTGMLKGMGMAIGTAGIVAGISKTIQHFDRLGKIATRLDMSAEALQRLGHAANMSGSNMEQLQGIMTRLERRTGEALQNTTGSQAQRFKELNIEVEAFSNLNPEDKILAIADAFNALGGTEKSVASLMGLLDTEVRELLPLLKQGSDGIIKLMQDTTALTDIEVKAMEDAADAVQKFNQFASTSFGQSLIGLEKYFMGFHDLFKKLFNPNLSMPSSHWKKDGATMKQAITQMKDFGYNPNRSASEKALMEKYNTGDLRIAREMDKEPALKRNAEEQARKYSNMIGASMAGNKGWWTKKDFTGDAPRITESKTLNKSISEMALKKGLEEMIKKGVGGKALNKHDFLQALMGGDTGKRGDAPGIATGKALDQHDFLQALMGGDTGAMAKATSSTSGRFGEFVAAATLGSGQGRMVSQRRGIRIEGIDKQTRILEELKKHLDELAGNTTP